MSDPADGGRVPLVERLLPPVELHGEDGSLKPVRMTPREQLVAAGLGFLNVAITVFLANVIEQDKALVLVTGVLAAAAIIVGARVGNRLVTLAGLFASTLITGGAFFVLAVPSYAGAFWIFLKYNRLMKDQAALRRQQRAEQRGSIAATPRSGRTRGRPGTAKAAKAASASAPAKAPPPKSKRYTPPKAKKKPRSSQPPKPPRDRSIVD